MTDFYFIPYMKKPLVALKSHLFVLKYKTTEYYENKDKVQCQKLIFLK